MQRYIAVLKVIEVGSFTKAAELLGYTQPALSQMIASLEKELSIKILYRSRYGIQLTPEGERLYPFMKNSVQQYETMKQAADEIRGLEEGIVRIGTISSISCHWLPGIIRQFWEKYPKIKVVLHQGDYTSIPDWVRTGSVDFGFVNPKAVRGMEIVQVKSGEFRAVVPSGHPLAERKSVSLKDLAQEPFLMLEEGIYSEPMEAFREAGITPDVRLRVHDDYSILSMVEQGLGVSILAELVLRKTNYNIAALPIEPPVIRDLGIIMKDKHSLPLASREFLKCLMENRENLL